MSLAAIVDIILKGVPPLNLESSIANGLKYVKADGGLLQSGVPSGYTAVEYIENGTNTLVRTGISYTNSDQSVKLEVQCRTVQGSFYILQARDYVNDNAAAEARSSGVDPTATSTILGISGPASGQKLAGNAGTDSGVTLDNISRIAQKTVRLVFTAENGNQTLYCKDLTNDTDETKTTTYNPATLTRPKTEMCFFGNMAPAYTPSGGGSSVNPNRLTAGCRLYSAKIWKNGVLVRDYVPAVRDSDSVVGLYDRVSNTFTTKSAGSLTAGNSLAPTPSDPVDLVCNNGALKISDKSQWAIFTNPTSIAGRGVFISSTGIWTTASDRGAGVAIPLTVGKQYTMVIHQKSVSLGTILRYGQSPQANPTSAGIQLTDWYRGSMPENGIMISFVAKEAYFVMQLSAASAEAGMIQEAIEVLEAQGDNEILAITTKNLCNVAADTDGKYIAANGTIASNADSCYSDLIPVVAGQTYTWSGICGNSGGSNNKRVHAYIDDVWNQQVNLTEVSANQPFAITFTVPAGCNGIRISHWNTDTQTQVEVGSAKTSYIEYNGSTANVANLLKLNNYVDTQEILTGLINHQLGICVLTGQENWQLSTSWASTNTRVFYAVDSSIYHTEDMYDTVGIVCTHYVSTTRNILRNNDVECCSLSGTTSPAWTFRVLKTDFSDVTAWTTWLAAQYSAGTPVIVVYPLATAQDEVNPVPQTMQTVAGDNTLDIVQSGMTGLEVEVKYTKG